MLMKKCIYTLGNPKVGDCQAIFNPSRVCSWALEFQRQTKYIRLYPSKTNYKCLVYIPTQLHTN